MQVKKGRNKKANDTVYVTARNVATKEIASVTVYKSTPKEVIETICKAADKV